MSFSKDRVHNCFQKVLQKGAEYSDCRFFATDKRQMLFLDNGNLKINDTSIYSGIGVRVLFKGAWGFYASSDADALEHCFDQALLHAQAAASLIRTELHLGIRDIAAQKTMRYESPSETAPGSVGLKDKLDFMKGINESLSQDWIVRKCIKVKCVERDIHFLSSEGCDMQRIQTHTFGNFAIYAKDNNNQMQKRSHNLYTTGLKTRGWELILDPALFTDHVHRVKDELHSLTTAPDLEYGIRSLILLPGQGHLQLHETIGHPLELDRILGYELSFAGGSFVRLDDFGKLQYASPKLNVSIFDDLENSPGSFGFDDEGTPQHTYMIIDKGILVNALSSRASIALANSKAGKKVFTTSGATSRANNFYRSPIERMSNLNIRPGNDGSLQDIVATTENGVIMDNPTSWSISSNRDHFHFACEIAWEVREGKITRVLKNPSYRGHTLDLYRNLSAVGDASTWRVEQVENCGKAEPNQEIELGHGVPVLKFENVITGEQG